MAIEKFERLTQDSSPPLCSIGLPVYNAEAHLEQALDSILGQTLTDTEVIISDNCSTDASLSICESYARNDSRIRLYVQEKNIGASLNWNFVFNQSHGRYFKWTSANDYIAEDMIERCIAELDRDESLVLVFGHTMMLGDKSDEREIYQYDFELMQDDPVTRFFELCWNITFNNPQLGVIRRSALEKTRLDRIYRSGDLVLMAELALLGKFRLLDETVMWQRMGSGFCSSRLDPYDIAEFLDPGNGSSNRFYLWKRMVDELSALIRAELSLQDKIRGSFLQLRRLWWLRKHLLQNLSELRSSSA